jgi:hypothetical protein
VERGRWQDRSQLDIKMNNNKERRRCTVSGASRMRHATPLLPTLTLNAKRRCHKWPLTETETQGGGGGHWVVKWWWRGSAMEEVRDNGKDRRRLKERRRWKDRWWWNERRRWKSEAMMEKGGGTLKYAPLNVPADLGYWERNFLIVQVRAGTLRYALLNVPTHFIQVPIVESVPALKLIATSRWEQGMSPALPRRLHYWCNATVKNTCRVLE